MSDNGGILGRCSDDAMAYPALSPTILAFWFL